MASSSPSLRALSPEEALRSRPPELEDRLNRLIYHPLAARLARLLMPTGISPNAVSVAGALLIWAAAWAYTGLSWPLSALLGFSLHALWHVVDGADGDLARLTGRTSPTGELVDGVCDYSGHCVLYIALAAHLDAELGGWAWLLATAAAASHIVQTNHAETQRRNYLWWAYGVPWLKHAQAADDEVFRGRNWFSLTFAWLAREYLRLAQAMTPCSARIDAQIEAAAGDRRRLGGFARIVRRASRVSLAYEKAVGPNPRTLILGLSMALGSPIYFFLTECVLLNLLLALSVRHHNARDRELLERLARISRVSHA